jgi:PAS domain S-box-containing protein
MSLREPQVFIVDDDEDTRSNLSDILELHGFRVRLAPSARQMLETSDWPEVDVVLLDRRLPDGSPEQLLPLLKRCAPHAGTIIITGYADVEGAVACLRAGAADYIVKPVNADALLASIARELERQNAQREITRLSHDLQAKNAELDTILNVFPSDFAIAVAEDRDCQFVHVNECLARILDISSGMNASCSTEVPGRSAYQIWSEGRVLLPEEMPLQRAAGHGEQIKDCELQICRADGVVVDLLGYAVPLFDESGQTRGAIGAFRDITERKRAAESLARSERRYRALFENAMEGFLILNDAWEIIDANPAACRKLNYAPDELLGKRINDLIVAVEEDTCSLLHAFTHSERAAGECRLLRPTGVPLDAEYRAVANFSPGLHLFSLRNVTDRKRAEERARQSERLAAIGETMTALVHESRNALQRSSACLEMLALEVEDRPDALDLVARTQRAQEQLNHLYEEVRQWAAPMILRREPCNLADVWREAWQQVMQLLPAGRIRLQEDIQCRPVCKIDRSLMEQVFRNTFENAVEVSPQGGVISVHCSNGSGRGGNALQVLICDQGPGFTAEQQARLFEPFFTTKTKGTGLGMAICQRIVQAHDGTIDAKSPGGAQIEILLPKGML